MSEEDGLVRTYEIVILVIVVFSTMGMLGLVIRIIVQLQSPLTVIPLQRPGRFINVANHMSTDDSKDHQGEC